VAEIHPLLEALIEEFSSPNASSTVHKRHAFGAMPA
jgi:hypothetical protein